MSLIDLSSDAAIKVWDSSARILAGTGHRPNKLNNEYDLSGPFSREIKNELVKCITTLKPRKIISGMALGLDQLLALTSIELGIKVIAAVPCDNQESRWPKKSQDLYFKILNDPLVTFKVVSPGPYHVSKMQTRNCWMVNNCDGIFAAWDGTEGGTANCVNYAVSVGKPIWRMDPSKITA